MIKYDQIITMIFEQIHLHRTQLAYAKKIGMSPSYLNDIINGRQKISGLTLQTINKLFPNVTLRNDSHNVTISNNNHNNVVLGNNSTIALAKIMACEDIPDNIKVRIYNLLTTED